MMREEFDKQWEAKKREIENNNPNREKIENQDIFYNDYEELSIDFSKNQFNMIIHVNNRTQNGLILATKVIDLISDKKNKAIKYRETEIGKLENEIERINRKNEDKIKIQTTRLKHKIKNYQEEIKFIKEIKEFNVNIIISDCYIKTIQYRLELIRLDMIEQKLLENSVAENITQDILNITIDILDSYIGELPLELADGGVDLCPTTLDRDEYESIMKKCGVYISSVNIYNSCVKFNHLYDTQEVNVSHSVVHIENGDKCKVRITDKLTTWWNERKKKKETQYPFNSIFIQGNYQKIDFSDNQTQQSSLIVDDEETKIQSLTLTGINLSKQMILFADTLNPENSSFVACTLDNADFIKIEDPRLKIDLVKRFRHVFDKQRYFREAEILKDEELRLQIAQMTSKKWRKYVSSEYLVIKCSDYFSDFGKSLWRPFRLLLHIALLFFLMTHCTNYLGNYSFSGQFAGWDFLADMLSTMIALPNSEFGTGGSKFFNIIGFIMIKFLTGYLLYNFIRATRQASCESLFKKNVFGFFRKKIVFLQEHHKNSRKKNV
jgi:hypothetical protein